MEHIERLHKRNELAKRLVNTTYKHLATGLDTRAKETHERELKEWGLDLENITQAEDVHLYISIHYPSTTSANPVP